VLLQDASSSSDMYGFHAYYIKHEQYGVLYTGPHLVYPDDSILSKNCNFSPICDINDSEEGTAMQLAVIQVLQASSSARKNKFMH
ncbi:hypothetical protein ACJX0J_023774, partial [Zea mays]